MISPAHALPSAPAAVLPPRDEDGFLLDAQDWTPALAAVLAAAAGVDDLGPAHWRVIDHVRSRYFAFGSLPVMRLVCRAAGIDPRSAHRLFDSCTTLWRVAGLPHPGLEARAYMH
jgi:tRNA 2-thiouridine synthesizing protein E